MCKQSYISVAKDMTLKYGFKSPGSETQSKQQKQFLGYVPFKIQLSSTFPSLKSEAKDWRDGSVVKHTPPALLEVWSTISSTHMAALISLQL